MLGRLSHGAFILVMATRSSGVACEKLLRCHPSVGKFSSRESPRHYHTCEGGLEHPLLAECKDGSVYHTQLQKCVTESENKISAINDKALGMNFQLGSLFDARESRFYQDSSPWSPRTLEEAAYEYNRLGVKTEFTADKTVKSKTVGMGIGAKFSFELLFGLITITGSASYARSETKTDTEVHVQMNYYTTKYALTIPKKTLIDFPEVCNSSQYTHVVTSVTYGLEAIMDFHKKTRDEDFEGNIAGSLGWILNMIPGLATGSSHMSEEDRVIADSCTITVFGDFSPDDKPLPANLDQAVEFYRQMPALTGSKENHWQGTTIQEFHASPISDICADLNPTLNEINESLMTSVGDMLDNLEKLMIRVGGLLDTDVSIRFTPVQDSLQLYKKSLKEYTAAKKKTLKEVVPRIRGGNQEAEEDLILMLNEYETSVYQIDKSLEFLINRGREINAINFLLESFPTASNRLVQDFGSSIDAKILFQREKVVLLELNVLSDTNVTSSFLDGNTIDEDNFWYNIQRVSGQVGSTLRTFLDFAEANVDMDDRGYLIKLNLVSDEDPTCMTAFLKGSLMSDPFEVPITSDDIKPFGITVNGFKLSLPKVNQFVQSVSYTVTDLTTGSELQGEKEFGASEEITVVVDSMLPLHRFTFDYTFTTELGTSPPSIQASPFFTTPSTEPQDLTVERTFELIHLSWKPPATIANNLKPLLQYHASLWQGESVVSEQWTTDQEVRFDKLEAATEYRVTVSAYVPDYPRTPTTHRNVEGPSASITTFTLPHPPTILDPKQVTDTSISLTWVGSQLAPGAEATQYTVQFDTLDYNGTKTLEGTTKQTYVMNTDESGVTISELEPSTLYAFKTMAMTTEGDSSYSSNFYIQTDFNQTALEELLNDISEQASASAADLMARARFCGWRARSQGAGAITYTRVFTGDEELTSSSMDPASGLFTAGRTGVYKVMVSAKMRVYAGHTLRLWVMKGEEKVGESVVDSMGLVDNPRTDIASREVALLLEAGDKVSLYMEANDIEDEVNYLTFCVASVALD